MGKSVIKSVFAATAALFCLAAEAATSLRTDPAVSTGRLDCGLSYYIVSNASKKGLADFALVRKRDRDTVGMAAETEFSRRSLDSLPHFTGRSPLEFLSGNGIAYPRSGYISVGHDAVLYHFRNVRLARTPKITDSTLLLLFDIVMKTMRGEAPSDSSEHVIENQALIIAGDVDRDAMVRKMDILSLMLNRGKEVPAAEEPDSAGAKIPDTDRSLRLNVSEDRTNGLANVDAVFYGPRLPRSMRGSTAFLVSSQFRDEFRIAVEDRLCAALKTGNIPYSSVRMRSYDPMDSPGREKFAVSVQAAAGDTARVKRLLLSVLADIKEEGLSDGEYSYIRAVSDDRLYTRSIALSKENADYVRKCVDAFVYGSAIVSPQDEAAFFLSSGLPDSTRLHFLNGYISSLLPDIPDSCRIGSPVPGLNMRDTLLLPEGHVKVKLRKARTGKVTGADIWTFSNGMMVIYRKMQTNGRMYYSLVTRGGVSSVSDLKAGEGAFYSDMLFQGNICGIEGPVFRRMLAAEGVGMEAAAGLTDTRIYGSAPFDRLTLVLKSLLAVSEGYSANEDLAGYYMECERLRLSSARGEYQSRLAVIDSIMSPGYRYGLNKSVSGLCPDLAPRAERFCKSQFSKANDGALVLVGDMDAYDVRKILESFLGGFRTERYLFRRPSVIYQPVSGWSTYVTDGRSDSMDAVLSARLTLNSTNYMSSRIATMAVSDVVGRTLADFAMTARVSGSFRAFPHERYTVSVSAIPVPLSSLPASVTVQSYFRALYDVRSAIAALAEKGLDDSQTAVYKAALVDRYDSMQSDPVFWMRVIADRVSSGKDLEMKYGEKISAVTKDNVNAVLKSVYEGSMVEYVIKKD